MGVALDGFLDRAVTVELEGGRGAEGNRETFGLFSKSIKQAPLERNAMVLKLGLDKKLIAEFKSLKLLATLCQLATICKTAGHRWPADAGHVVGDWDKEKRIAVLQRLFAVNQLRQKATHRTGTGFAGSLAGDLGAFGIEPAAQAAGWGRAVDTLYDGLIDDFNAISPDLLKSPTDYVA